MWFKNSRVYQLSSPLSLDQSSLEQALAEFRFTPCTGQQQSSLGFSFPFESAQSYCYQNQQYLFFAVKRQEKLLPAAVVQDEMQPRLQALEAEKGRALSRKEKDSIKEEVTFELLPRAFSKTQLVLACYDQSKHRIMIHTSSSSRAEEVLALLRKAIGSLPALPWLDPYRLSNCLQFWLQSKQLPASFQLGHEVELKAPDEEGAKVRFSNHLLTTDEVQSHLQDKQVTRLELQQEEGLSLKVCDDGSLKSIRYHDSISSKNDELGWEDAEARLAADSLLMASTLSMALDQVAQAVIEVE
ncbi:recombination-associated protein RdgC [Alkalimonas sp. MEB108]|uniref:Recombination-associated protein RdgC n=1 Tax=Alkalimonas cellulosilytica TaxID=3058395 RepID=A0ABU7J3I1_9GAMM|nr:recombination-associated protein RdgC [Alkalimonas sp. MEB108]MEE2001060.1 recombination-associated protein RdgC [Alkalimonas sp. MEB108]